MYVYVVCRAGHCILDWKLDKSIMGRIPAKVGASINFMATAPPSPGLQGVQKVLSPGPQYVWSDQVLTPAKTVLRAPGIEV